MAKFRLCASSISYCYIDIEAKDEDEAREVYEELDGSEFYPEPYGDFRLDEIIPLEDDDDVDVTAKEVLYPEY